MVSEKCFRKIVGYGEDWIDKVKSEVSGELTLEVGMEVVVREERVEDVFIGAHIWVLEIVMRNSTVRVSRQ